MRPEGFWQSCGKCLPIMLCKENVKYSTPGPGWGSFFSFQFCVSLWCVTMWCANCWSAEWWRIPFDTTKHACSHGLTHWSLVLPSGFLELWSSLQNGRQAITSTTADLLSFGNLESIFNEIWIKKQNVSVKKMHFYNVFCRVAAILFRYLSLLQAHNLYNIPILQWVYKLIIEILQKFFFL